MSAASKDDAQQRSKSLTPIEQIVPIKELTMAKRNRGPKTPETGEQIPARRHDAGSGANETIDGLDGITEELRHAAENPPSGAGPGKIEKTPVFERGDLAPKI